MAFCSACGTALENSAKFCPSCGRRVTSVNSSQESQHTTRTVFYAGSVLKCPHCDAAVSPLDAICPECGYELTDGKVADSLTAFIEKIEQCDKRIAASGEKPKKGWTSWPIWLKIIWVLLNIYMACAPLLFYAVFWILPRYIMRGKTLSLTAEEVVKSNVIKNYIVPNDRHSIINALMFIQQQFAFLTDEKLNANNYYWMRIWAKKADQLYLQAEKLFPGDAMAKDMHDQIASSHKLVRRKRLIRRAILVFVAIAWAGFVVLRIKDII